jgi:hypothetical protein
VQIKRGKEEKEQKGVKKNKKGDFVQYGGIGG